MPRKKTEAPSVPNILEQVTENTVPAEIIPEQQPVQLSSEDGFVLEEASAENLPAAELLEETDRKRTVIDEVEETSEEPLPNAEENTTLPAVPQKAGNPTEPAPPEVIFSLWTSMHWIGI